MNQLGMVFAVGVEDSEGSYGMIDGPNPDFESIYDFYPPLDFRRDYGETNIALLAFGTGRNFTFQVELLRWDWDKDNWAPIDEG